MPKYHNYKLNFLPENTIVLTYCDVKDIHSEQHLLYFNFILNGNQTHHIYFSYIRHFDLDGHTKKCTIVFLIES